MSGKKTVSPDRRAREATALRANLKKRKAQARERAKTLPLPAEHGTAPAANPAPAKSE